MNLMDTADNITTRGLGARRNIGGDQGGRGDIQSND